jgi:hypothetical protein
MKILLKLLPEYSAENNYDKVEDFLYWYADCSETYWEPKLDGWKVNFSDKAEESAFFEEAKHFNIVEIIKLEV